MARHAKQNESQEPKTAAEAQEQINALKKTMQEAFVEMTKIEKKKDVLIQKEWKETERRQDLARTLVPTMNAKKELSNSKIEIIYSNKLGAKGVKALTAPGLEIARQLEAVFADIGVTPQVTARTWSTSGNGVFNVPLEGENNTIKLSPSRDFAKPATYIKRESKSANENIRGKNYIVVTNGNIFGGDLQALVDDLSALADNSGASVDFVINPKFETGAIERLVAKLKDTPAAKQVNFVKVGSDDEILDAVKGVIKARITERVAPKTAEAAPSAPEKKRRLFKSRQKKGPQT